MAEQAEEVGEWRGGKPPGSVKERVKYWFYQFKGEPAKAFDFEKFGGRESAEIAARAHQRAIAVRRGLPTKNQWRICVAPEGREYVEFHIESKGEDFYPRCEVADLPLLENSNWFIHRRGGNRYVFKNARIEGKDTTQYLHSLKRPEWLEVDHINRNGLDNLDANLRDGGCGENQRNHNKQANNTSGVTGVGRSMDDRYWVVRIGKKETYRCKYIRGPNDKNHPAWQEAVALRKEWEAECGFLNG